MYCNLKICRIQFSSIYRCADSAKRYDCELHFLNSYYAHNISILDNNI